MVTQDIGVDLGVLPLFRGVPDELLEDIGLAHIRHYEHDEALFHQGETADNLMLLLRGQVSIITDRTYIIPRAAYEVIGEQAFINGTVRNGTAIAQGMVRALVLPRPLVERLMGDATFCQNLLRIVSEKLTQATSERAFRYQKERLLFSEFRAHVSSEVTQRLLSSGLSYGDPRYTDAVILFSDIRSFTQRSAGMDPQGIAEQLSPYLDAVVDVIHRHGGLVDKFVGDAVMAIWGFAATGEDFAPQAFACAKEMVAVAARHRFGGEPIAIGVGLNAGQVFIGNIGGEGKRQFTVLGTPVNLAARFEAESKDLGAPIVMGENFVEQLSAEARGDLVLHRERPIKGADPQTVYTCDVSDVAA